MAGAPARLVVILGAHRTGTSAITRMLPVLGVGLGKVLLPADPRNEKGYWEDFEFMQLNNAMLTYLGKPWYHLSPISQEDVARLADAGFADLAVEALRERCSEHAVFGLKDPRITKLLPFWAGIFAREEFDCTYLLAVRNPRSAARSIAKRDGFSEIHGYDLWTTHMVAAVSHAGDRPCIAIAYDTLLDDPEAQVEKLSAALGLPVDRAALNQYAQTFLDRNLSHSSFSHEDLAADAKCPDVAREIYAGLDGLARLPGPIAPSKLAELAALWQARMDASRGDFAQFDADLGIIPIPQGYPKLRIAARKLVRSLFRILPFRMPEIRRTMKERLMDLEAGKKRSDWSG